MVEHTSAQTAARGWRMIILTGSIAVLGEVSGAAAQTRQSAENVLTASQAVEAAAIELRREVEGFLSGVAA
jgi:hypothetical protein